MEGNDELEEGEVAVEPTELEDQNIKMEKQKKKQKKAKRQVGAKSGSPSDSKTSTTDSFEKIEKKLKIDNKTYVKKPKNEFVSSTFKTKPCEFYRKGACQKGDDCTYSHDIQMGKPDVVCKFFLTSNCTKGDNCMFSHDLKKYPCKYFWGTGCSQGPQCKFSHEPIRNDQKIMEFIEENEDFFTGVYEKYKTLNLLNLGNYFFDYLQKKAAEKNKDAKSQHLLLPPAPDSTSYYPIGQNQFPPQPPIMNHPQQGFDPNMQANPGMHPNPMGYPTPQNKPIFPGQPGQPGQSGQPGQPIYPDPNVMSKQRFMQPPPPNQNFQAKPMPMQISGHPYSFPMQPVQQNYPHQNMPFNAPIHYNPVQMNQMNQSPAMGYPPASTTPQMPHPHMNQQLHPQHPQQNQPQMQQHQPQMSQQQQQYSQHQQLQHQQHMQQHQQQYPPQHQQIHQQMPPPHTHTNTFYQVPPQKAEENKGPTYNPQAPPFRSGPMPMPSNMPPGIIQYKGPQDNMPQMSAQQNQPLDPRKRINAPPVNKNYPSNMPNMNQPENIITQPNLPVQSGPENPMMMPRGPSQPSNLNFSNSQPFTFPSNPVLPNLKEKNNDEIKPERLTSEIPTPNIFMASKDNAISSVSNEYDKKPAPPPQINPILNKDSKAPAALIEAPRNEVKKPKEDSTHDIKSKAAYRTIQIKKEDYKPKEDQDESKRETSKEKRPQNVKAKSTSFPQGKPKPPPPQSSESPRRKMKEKEYFNQNVLLQKLGISKKKDLNKIEIQGDIDKLFSTFEFNYEKTATPLKSSKEQLQISINETLKSLKEILSFAE